MNDASTAAERCDRAGMQYPPPDVVSGGQSRAGNDILLIK